MFSFRNPQLPAPISDDPVRDAITTRLALELAAIPLGGLTPERYLAWAKKAMTEFSIHFASRIPSLH